MGGILTLSVSVGEVVALGSSRLSKIANLLCTEGRSSIIYTSREEKQENLFFAY